jgi:hypothetical protein
MHSSTDTSGWRLLKSLGISRFLAASIVVATMTQYVSAAFIVEGWCRVVKDDKIIGEWPHRYLIEYPGPGEYEIYYVLRYTQTGKLVPVIAPRKGLYTYRAMPQKVVIE